MAVSFECNTRSRLARTELSDLARNIDAHKESMQRSRETAVAGLALRSGATDDGTLMIDRREFAAP